MLVGDLYYIQNVACKLAKELSDESCLYTVCVSSRLKLMTDMITVRFCRRDSANWPKKKADVSFGAVQQVKAC